MPRDTREERLAARVAALYATDSQFAAARPSAAVTESISEPGLRLPEIVSALMTGYADRPALGQRRVRFVTDPTTGRTIGEFLPQFDTISYRQLEERVGIVVRALKGTVQAGDRVCILGFTSVDYTVIDMALIPLGAVAVPLPISGAVAQLEPIVTETEPTAIASSIDQVPAAVELLLMVPALSHLVVFDYWDQVDEHREILDAARMRLAEAGSSVIVETLDELLHRGKVLPEAPAVISAEQDPLTLLIYTSGSTGSPKGVIYPESMVANYWLVATKQAANIESAHPWIVLSFMPMSHTMGRGVLYGALGMGGTVYFAAKSDLSTLLEDLALTRTTQLNFVPRIWEIVFQDVRSELDRRIFVGASAAEIAAIEAKVMAQHRQRVLGGRFIWALTGSAPTSGQMRKWVEDYLDMPLTETYGSTEVAAVFTNGHVLRPPVIDYKLVDVPDLGYYGTDQPYPRGELLLKTENLFPGYYKRPEVTAGVFDEDGYYRTGDIVAQIGPDQLAYLERRNNVFKLSQGEFVTIARLEAVFSDSPLVRQIYVYGNSAHPYLLAVVVPTEDVLARVETVDALKPMIAASLQDMAKEAGLQSYEVPRDFIVDTTAFTLENGLLTGVRKMARPKLKAHYGERLEQLYTELAEGQSNELNELRRSGADAPVLVTVSRAAAALLGAAVGDLAPDAHFTDLGGDSLSALTYANLLHEIFGVDVPVGVIVSPATDLAGLADYIETERAGSTRPTFANVHGRDAVEVAAADLTLDKFLDAATLEAAPGLPGPSAEVRTVLLTGATGFLGRYLALQWLERLAAVGGMLICLVRAKSDAEARVRLDATFDSGDPKLLARYTELAAAHLQVLAGDKGEANLGLDAATWQRLAEDVDVIVDPAALVNHVLPYSQLFGPNALGTAELIRLALTSKIKPFTYVSTIGVGDQITPGQFVEDADVRVMSPIRAINDGYANGYGNSKWAGEVLLREANDLCGLPVSVFRCDMILADTSHAGQLNLPDMFTRTMLSLVATGIAPGSFNELDADGNRQRSHYDGLPVEFIAEAITTLGPTGGDGFATYHVMNPYDDGLGMDEFVDWLTDAGYTIQRIADYGDWLQRFETSLRALPDKQRQASLLPLLPHTYQKPATPICGSIAPTDRFRTAVQDAKIGPDRDIPHVTPAGIVKYITDLQLLGLL